MRAMADQDNRLVMAGVGQRQLAVGVLQGSQLFDGVAAGNGALSLIAKLILRGVAGVNGFRCRFFIAVYGQGEQNHQ